MSGFQQVRTSFDARFLHALQVLHDGSRRTFAEAAAKGDSALVECVRDNPSQIIADNSDIKDDREL